MALVTVTGRFEFPDNSSPGEGTMLWTLLPDDIPDTSEPSVVMSGPIEVAINSNGEFSVALRATNDPQLTANVTGTLYYHVVRRLGTHESAFRVSVPSPGPVDWADLSPVPAGASSYVVAVQGPEGPTGATGATGTSGTSILSYLHTDTLYSSAPSEQIIHSYTVAAGVLSAGKVIHLFAAGYFGANANSKTVGLGWGTSPYSSSRLAVTEANNSGFWQGELWIVRNISTNAYVTSRLRFTDSTGLITKDYGHLTSLAVNLDSSSFTLGIISQSTANNDIHLDIFDITFWN